MTRRLIARQVDRSTRHLTRCMSIWEGRLGPDARRDAICNRTNRLAGAQVCGYHKHFQAFTEDPAM
jgi:hypothetical protein